jgi:glutathione S-transferase
MTEGPPRQLVPWGVGASRTPLREYASWLEWCFYAATELDTTSLYVMRRHGDPKRVNGKSPLALESAADYLATQLRHAEQALWDGRPFLVGGRSTTADMLLATCLSWAVSYRLAGDCGLPRLHGEDQIPADLPCQCCGQQAEGGTAGSARRLLLGDTASGWEIAIQREMSQVSPGPRRR